MADRGYDAASNYTYLDQQRILSVIHMRNTDKSGIYTTRGRPKCLGGEAMDYIETDPTAGHLFRCPPDGCRLKGKMAFTRYCDNEHYENPVGQSRVAAESREIAQGEQGVAASIPSERTIIERLFNSLKSSRIC